MKFVDKIKNYFYDGEDDDTDKKKIVNKMENRFLRDKEHHKEEIKEEAKEEKAVNERELFKSDPTFNFPIIFDEEEVKEVKAVEPPPRDFIRRDVQKIIEHSENKKFKPSPNISPVYGIIEHDDIPKKSEETNSNKHSSIYDDKKLIDIDDILGRGYDQKRVDLKQENYDFEKPDLPIPPKEDASFDLFDNEELNSKDDIEEPVVASSSIKKVDEKLKSIDELLENTNDDDFYSLVDSMYKEDNEDGNDNE